ncbi:flagellar motor protein [Actinoplanes sp. SE50]|uniref:flagellar motor protein MotB n=1 Tax=unclassified Actinoplanes TaxID=2626549 RepID=UPI00023EDEFA|nr:MULTISPECIES: flagellar motor protein MotB [unclassified Actinoplanes]AEV88801.1 Chemotaxis protein motB [Actinoplanes sp. SE50/110]ATO87207.1 flagellar motor protein [Actinoplanes sp. SE50]SLM04625.1 flagellar motor protein motB [Actinoplanes sp. SE50/110]
MSSGGGGAKRKKKAHEEHEEHVNHERWLVSYADMLTLLFVLFVVLFSMSDINQKKFAQLAQGLSASFGSKSAAFTGNYAPLDGSANNAQVVQIDPGANPGDGSSGTEGLNQKQQEAVSRAVMAEDRKKASANADKAAKEAENMKAIENKISDALAAAKLLDNVKFTIDQRGLVVTVVTNEVVFAGDRADLRPTGEKILGAIAPTLAKLPNNVEVDGNTNQLNAKTRYYPSGWELSAARASTTVRYFTGHGIAKKRLSAVGFSDTKPLIDPKDPRSITMNRRVDVVVLTMLTADQAALLPSAAGSDAKLHAGQTTAEAKALEKAVESANSSSTTTGTTGTTNHSTLITAETRN